MSHDFSPYAGGGFPGAPPRQYTDYEVDLIAARYADVPLPNLYPTDVPLPTLSAAGAGYFDAHLGARRPADVLYHHSFMGSHSTVGQSEPLYSSNTMGKRPRLESSLAIYPQRPGEKACAFYMRTKTCKYGQDCRFDHPQWVLEGGIPNLREAPNVEDFYPERPGEPDCTYFMKSGECKFKSKCKFNHPKRQQSLIADSAILPVRPSETVCPLYEKTDKCKFGANCKFNHPEDLELRVPTLAGKQTIYTATIDAELKTHKPPAPAEAYNTKGLPLRPGEVDCSFYMKTGSCMYGSICRYNHPERPDVATTEASAAPVVKGILPTPAPVVKGILPTPAPIAPAAVLNPIATSLPGFDIHATLMPVEPEPIIYPQRPGETVCDFYMKTGYCKYTDKCKFHHPVDRSVPRPNESWDPQQTVALTLAGLPRREDAEICSFYLKSGTCKFGVHCKFDHPPPEEAITKLKAAGKNGRKKAAKLMAATAKSEPEAKTAEGASS